jgi:HlyD family secretion protein
MLPGYSADIEVILNESGQTLRIPTEALLEGNRVLVMTADGLLAEREIGIGLSNWAWTEVLTGLDAGEEVVTSVEREGVADGVSAVREPQAGDDD